jgi:hypothetical protein
MVALGIVVIEADADPAHPPPATRSPWVVSARLKRSPTRSWLCSSLGTGEVWGIGR